MDLHQAAPLPKIRGSERENSSVKTSIHKTRFVINEIRSPEEIKIDAQLQGIFGKLNQSYSTSINSPHTAFLKQQIDDYLHINQNMLLYSKEDIQTQKKGQHPESVLK